MQGQPRSAFQLASPPTANDRSLGNEAVFYLITDPRRTYRLTADGAWFYPSQPEPRTAVQLASIPSAQDIACRHGHGFYLDSDPSRRYTVNDGGTAYAHASRARRRPGSVATFKYGREVLMGSTAITVSQYARAPANAIAFRFAMLPGATAFQIDLARWAITGNGISDTVQNAVLSVNTWNSATPLKGGVTFGGAATLNVPAQQATARPGPRQGMDWVYPGTRILKGQMAGIRARLTAAGSVYSYTSMGFTVNADFQANYLPQTRFPVVAITDTSDRVTGDAAWAGITLANLTTNLPFPIVEWLLADGSVAVNCAYFGDSTAGGTVNTGSAAQALSPITLACEAMSTDAVVLASQAWSWSGVDQRVYYQHFLQAMADSAPDIAILRTGSQNDVDASFASTVLPLCAAFGKACEDLAVEPGLETAWPFFNSTLAQDNARKANNAALAALGRIVLDSDSVLSDGATPARMKVAYNVGQAHPSTAQAYVDVANLATKATVRLLAGRQGIVV